MNSMIEDIQMSQFMSQQFTTPSQKLGNVFLLHRCHRNIHRTIDCIHSDANAVDAFSAKEKRATLSPPKVIPAQNKRCTCRPKKALVYWINGCKGGP